MHRLRTAASDHDSCPPTCVTCGCCAQAVEPVAVHADPSQRRSTLVLHRWHHSFRRHTKRRPPRPQAAPPLNLAAYILRRHWWFPSVICRLRSATGVCMGIGTRTLAACAVVSLLAGSAGAQSRVMTLEEVLARAENRRPRSSVRGWVWRKHAGGSWARRSADLESRRSKPQWATGTAPARGSRISKWALPSRSNPGLAGPPASRAQRPPSPRVPRRLRRHTSRAARHLVRRTTDWSTRMRGYVS